MIYPWTTHVSNKFPWSQRCSSHWVSTVHVFGCMQTIKAQISLLIGAVWWGPSLIANRIVGYYRMYQWRTKAWTKICSWTGWSESAHFVHVWRGPISISISCSNSMMLAMSWQRSESGNQETTIIIIILFEFYCPVNTVTLLHTNASNWQLPFLYLWKGRMTLEMISCQYPQKLCGQAGIQTCYPWICSQALNL